LVLAAFLLTWIPMVVLAVMDMVHTFGGATEWIPPTWLYMMAMWSMCAGSITYPILYGIYNRVIRKELCLFLSWSPKNWRMKHFYNEQRRDSKWSNYSEYAALRPRENSGTTVTVSQKSFTDSLATLQTRESSIPACKSSQDSGGSIISDDEEAKKERSTSTNQQRAIEEEAQLEQSWRVIKPRMSLAVLPVSLQHIVAHSKSYMSSTSTTLGDVSTAEGHPEAPSAASSISLEKRIQPDR